ncbi:hypothetical protein ACSYDW_06995 [Paeniglutamicibacter sp. R2-26]|uniref:hypothetical protein n=1 Tax=Paeniglutamicibacter sp. R2-26 TaxID=3144417 RepID=UPI003EE65E8E
MSLTLILRTIVPAFWAGVVGWLIGFVPAMEPLRELLLAQSDVITAFVGAVLLGGWVAFANWLAPKLPDWVARILMGSAKTPIYDLVATYEYADFNMSGRHEAFTQDYTDDTTAPAGDHTNYPVRKSADTTQDVPGRYKTEERPHK